MSDEVDTWMEEEFRSITKCCYAYMDISLLHEGKLVCRACKKVVGEWNGPSCTEGATLPGR
jgi:hypothetical protein